ncbi:hypothetical protein V1511DRAFT_503414 [Dipodascopsis uninucleata]
MKELRGLTASRFLIRLHTSPESAIGKWKNLNWLHKRVRDNVELKFDRQIVSRKPLVLDDGRVFTSTWRQNQTEVSKEANSIALWYRKNYRTQMKSNAIVENTDKKAESKRSVLELKKRAFLGELFRIFSRAYPPRSSGCPINPAGYFRPLEIIDTKAMDVKIPVKLFNNDPFGERYFMSLMTQIRSNDGPYSLEWLTVATTQLPAEGHDHTDLLSQKAKELGIAITEDMYSYLSRSNHTLEDVKMWQQCLLASTAKESLQCISPHQNWPFFLIDFILYRHLTAYDLKRLMSIVKRSFQTLNRLQQLIVFVRLVPHIYRLTPSYLPKLSRIFVDHGCEATKKSATYNNILRILSLYKIYISKESIQYVLEAQRILVHEILERQLSINRNGYMALASVLRLKSSEASKSILKLAHKNVSNKDKVLRVISAMITDNEAQNEMVKYYPKGQNAENIVRILQSTSATDALNIFDSLGVEGQKDIDSWDALIGKLCSFSPLTASTVFKVWNNLVESNIKPNQFVVQKLLNQLSDVDDAIRLIEGANDRGVLMTRRVLRAFILCCHRDYRNADAMSVARQFVSSLRPNDEQLSKFLASIENYRKWKLREYKIKHNLEERKAYRLQHHSTVFEEIAYQV